MHKKLSFLKMGIVILVLTNLHNFFMYISQLILGRALTTEGFGIFNSVSSFFITILSFTGFISYVVAKEFIQISASGKDHNQFIRKILKNSFITGIVITAFVVFFSKIISGYLRINSVKPVLVYSLCIFLVIWQGIFIGIFQGLKKYTLISYSLTIQSATRLLLTIVIFLLSLSYLSALTAILVSFIVVNVFYLYQLRDSFSPSDNAVIDFSLSYQRMFKGFFPLILFFAYSGIMSNIDIALVKHFFSDYETGIYSAGAIVGKIVFYLPGILMYVLFSEVLHSDVNGESSISKTLTIALITLLITGTVALLFFFFPECFLKIFIGEKYLSSAPVLITVSFSMAVLSMISVLFNFCVAKGIYFFILPSYTMLIAAIFSIYIFYHKNPIQVAYIFLICLLITFFINLAIFFLKFKKEIILSFKSLFKKYGLLPE